MPRAWDSGRARSSRATSRRGPARTRTRKAAHCELETLARAGLAGAFLPVCMAGQTVFIASMNAFELRRARDLLLSPVGMVCANVVFLSLGWYVALSP
jgi:hypothetical protein